MIPVKHTIGDTLKFTEQSATYPAPDYTLTLSFSNASKAYSVTSTANGQDHDFLIATTTTATWEPGKYKYQLFAVKGSERYTVRQGDFELLPDFSKIGDRRSDNQIILDAIIATLKGKASSDQSSVSIEGRSIQRYSYDELIKMRDKFSQLVASEKRADRARRGLSHSGTIKVRL